MQYYWYYGVDYIFLGDDYRSRVGHSVLSPTKMWYNKMRGCYVNIEHYTFEQC